MNNFSRFYKLSAKERIEFLQQHEMISSDVANILLTNPQLSEIVANNLIENQLSQFSLPFGVGLNFRINDKDVLVPMVTEETSVIAACSYAAKLALKHNGFTVKTPNENIIEGQIILDDIKDTDATIEFLTNKIPELINLSNNSQPSLIKRGGGATDISIKSFTNNSSINAFICIYLSVNTKDAMGANLVNSMLEVCAKQIKIWLNSSVLMSILSNYSLNRIYTAKCLIDPSALKCKEYAGIEVAERIVKATTYAKLDIFRATTHNKGIMNGVSAVVLATGNDTRAVEASIHAYATKNGSYQGLSNWIINNNGLLEGSLSLPLPIGIVGGSTKLLPLAQIALKMANISSVQDLGAIIAATGLAQNLAALRALVSEGIQKGHMSLHTRNLAISAGATSKELTKLVSLLKKEDIISLSKAQKLLEILRQEQG